MENIYKNEIKLVFSPIFWYLVPHFVSIRYFTLGTSGYFLPSPPYDFIRWTTSIFFNHCKFSHNIYPCVIIFFISPHIHLLSRPTTA